MVLLKLEIEHILYASRLVDGARGGEVDFEVTDGFESGFDLKVFVEVGGGRRGDAVGHEQPPSVCGFADIVFVGETEGKGEAGSRVCSY